MSRWWTKVVDKVWDHLVLDEPSPRKASKRAEEAGNVETAIEKARAEWIAARAYFDNVTDPDLIDHAIYAIEAAERKYMYLLRHAEEFGYRTAEQLFPASPAPQKLRPPATADAPAPEDGLTARPV